MSSDDFLSASKADKLNDIGKPKSDKFLSQILWKKTNKFWAATYSNKTSSFGQLHYMLTGEKTRREANKNYNGDGEEKNPTK